MRDKLLRVKDLGVPTSSFQHLHPLPAPSQLIPTSEGCALPWHVQLLFFYVCWYLQGQRSLIPPNGQDTTIYRFVCKLSFRSKVVQWAVPAGVSLVILVVELGCVHAIMIFSLQRSQLHPLWLPPDVVPPKQMPLRLLPLLSMDSAGSYY
jgi:hypothetical protein